MLKLCSNSYSFYLTFTVHKYIRGVQIMLIAAKVLERVIAVSININQWAFTKTTTQVFNS